MNKILVESSCGHELVLARNLQCDRQRLLAHVQSFFMPPERTEHQADTANIPNTHILNNRKHLLGIDCADVRMVHAVGVLIDLC